ncbi:MAG: isoprenylcysteine carboxylmethyltransferase family protein [Pseudonocardiaceae bacterium]
MPVAGFWHWLPLGALWVCWGLFGLVWLGGAIYNLRRAPATRERCALPWAWLIGIIAYVILYRLTPARVWTPITVEARWLVILGVVVLATATAFTLWARAVLGIMWTSAPVIKEHHALRTTGPYSLTRHPIYTGLLGMLAGTACISGLGPWVAIVALGGLLVVVKLRAEERLLERTFGETYQHYRRRVPLLVPRPHRSG